LETSHGSHWAAIPWAPVAPHVFVLCYVVGAFIYFPPQFCLLCLSVAASLAWRRRRVIGVFECDVFFMFNTMFLFF
jgi:hypothetical protein